MKDLPKITVIVITYNNERTIKRCASGILNQDYQKSSIELLNIDGGSTDKTVSILNKHGFRTVKSGIAKNAEAQRATGLLLAKHNLIVSIDADNYLPHARWIRMMVQPFVDDNTIVHSGTKYYAYNREDTIYNRYCALFGVLDPVVWYIGRPDRNMRYDTEIHFGKIIKQLSTYSIVKYDESSLPTVGCNGVVYRKDLLLKYAKSKPGEFLHIDVFVDLIRKGYSKFAIVETDIIHDTAVTIVSLIKKRIAFLEGYYLKTQGNNPDRRYLIVNPNNFTDVIKVIRYIFYSITFIGPLFDSLRGYLYIHDIAWFLHPFMCNIFLFTYGITTIKKLKSR